MLHYLRQIRQKLILQENARKYLLYAVGEILLVVIGILIALQINNWNEYKKKQQISDETIQNLKVELVEAKSILENALLFNSKIVSEAELFIYDEYNLDSLAQDPGKVFEWTNYRPISLNLLIVEQEVSSDRLILGNEELSLKLREIKKQSQNLEEALFYLDELWNNEVAPYFIRSKTMVSFHKNLRNKGLTIESVEILLKDGEYRNLTAMSNLLTDIFTKSGKRLAFLIEEAIAIIEEIN